MPSFLTVRFHRTHVLLTTIFSFLLKTFFLAEGDYFLISPSTFQRLKQSPRKSFEQRLAGLILYHYSTRISILGSVSNQD